MDEEVIRQARRQLRLLQSLGLLRAAAEIQATYPHLTGEAPETADVADAPTAFDEPAVSAASR